MKKEFNAEGTCNPARHFMVNISGKIEAVFSLIEKGKYFTINLPRQYGKTTTLFHLCRFLQQHESYVPIKLSFEGMGSTVLENESVFIKELIQEIKNFFSEDPLQEFSEFIKEEEEVPTNLSQFGNWISALVRKIKTPLVLLIDEVDQSSNNQLFLDFLGLLRKKYLLRIEDRGATFHSVILAGLHDVKTLKLKLRPDKEHQLNSPWNIATDFRVEMSFKPEEITTMLEYYQKENKVEFNLSSMAQKLHYYTSGYPFLVSKLCKIMDEDLMGTKKKWDEGLLELAVQQLLNEGNTNFESLIKNLENYPDLSNLVRQIILEGNSVGFSKDNTLIRLGVLHGILRNNGDVKIHNRIYEQRIYNYLTINLHIQQLIKSNTDYSIHEEFLNKGSLDFEKVLLKFQEFMRAQHSKKDHDFLERNGRLLFLSFLKPIINGKGFDFKEVQTSEEKRLDVVVTFMNQRFVVELKIWRGQKEHEKGLLQLSDYLERWNLNEGYLLIFDLRTGKNREWKTKRETVGQKEILAVWV